jgi:uncharacterized protein
MTGPVHLAALRPITDVCILVADIETSIAFYRDKLGFRLAHRADGFADFEAAGVTLALWSREHINRHVGIGMPATGSASVLIAIKLDTPDAIDSAYRELLENDVPFVRPPADYAWNARAVYFRGPDGEVWELYAWLDGGAPGAVDGDGSQ